MKQKLMKESNDYKGVIAQPPKSVELQLTYCCNLRCYMCGQWGPKGIFRNSISTLRKQEIGTDKWLKVIDMAAEWKSRINLWGGEPFLRKDIFKIINYIKSKELICSVVTNGVLIERYYREIIESQVDKIFLSIDGTEEIHDKIRGRHGIFKKVHRGMEKLSDFKKKKGTEKPFIEMLFTISKYNFKIIEEMINVGKGLGCNRVQLSALMYTTQKQCDKYIREYFGRFGCKPNSQKGWIVKNTGVEGKELDKKIEHISSRNYGSFVRISDCFNRIPPSYWYKDAGETFGYNQCLSPWLRLNIMPDGKANFCVDFPDYIIGDVNNESLSEIWNNEKARIFRKKYLKLGPLPICNRCCWLYSDYDRLINEWKYEG